MKITMSFRLLCAFCVPGCMKTPCPFRLPLCASCMKTPCPSDCYVPPSDQLLNCPPPPPPLLGCEITTFNSSPPPPSSWLWNHHIQLPLPPHPALFLAVKSPHSTVPPPLLPLLGCGITTFNCPPPPPPTPPVFLAVKSTHSTAPLYHIQPITPTNPSPQALRLCLELPVPKGGVSNINF